MADKEHQYAVSTTWTGNLGEGTPSYPGYSRDHEIRFATKPDQLLLGSADGAFRGDVSRYNPEELLVAALSQCHLLSYLHACVQAGVSVVDYSDDATGTMITTGDGSGRFTEVILHPQVLIAAGHDVDAAIAAHATAHRMCFIANSVNFDVLHRPMVAVAR